MGTSTPASSEPGLRGPVGRESKAEERKQRHGSGKVERKRRGGCPVVGRHEQNKKDEKTETRVSERRGRGGPEVVRGRMAGTRQG